MLYVVDTLDEEDVLMILNELEVQDLHFLNLILVKTTFSQNFVVNQRPTSSRPYYMLRTTRRIRAVTKQSNSSRSRSRIQGFLILRNICRELQ